MQKSIALGILLVSGDNETISRLSRFTDNMAHERRAFFRDDQGKPNAFGGLTKGMEFLQPWLEESLQRDSLVLFNR